MDDTNVAGEGATAEHPLAYVRRRHGWSYQDVARVIAEHARALGVPMAARREKVWRWEHWGVVPEADSQRALARALGIPPRELESRPWPRWLPAHGGMPDGLPWTADGSLRALNTLVEDGGSDPRGFPVADERALRDAIADWDAAEAEAEAAHGGGRAGPQAQGPARPRLQQQPRLRAEGTRAGGSGSSRAAPAGWDGGKPASGGPSPGSGDGRVTAARSAAEGGTVVDAPVAEWLEAGVLGLRQLDDRLGGGAVRQRVEADLRLVWGLLRRAGQSADTQNRLLRVAADLAQLGGWAATDTGRHAAAQRHYLTGLRLAHTAGDRSMAVALWSGLSLHAVIAGLPQDGVAAAEAAVRAACGAPPVVRALAASRLGRAHAAAGAEGAFRRAAEEAERQLDTAREAPVPSWLYWLDGAELAAQTGQSLLDLGVVEEAGPLLERALATLQPTCLRDRCLYSARAAQVRAMLGDRDGARTLGREAARLSRLCGSPRLAAALNALKPHLDAYC